MDKMSLVTIIMNNARLSTAISNQDSSKLKAVRTLEFGHELQIPLKIVGNNHFLIIFIFRLSGIANVLDLGGKSIATQENPVAEFSRSNFAKMNICGKLSINTVRILLESGELDNSRSSYPDLKFGSPHPLHSFASNPCRGKC